MRYHGYNQNFVNHVKILHDIQIHYNFWLCIQVCHSVLVCHFSEAFEA